MKTGIPRAALGLAALCALALAAPARADDFKTLSVDEVQRMLGRQDVKVFDANPPDLWQKHHLPGATFIGDKKLATLLPPDKGAKLVFYCAGPK